MEKGESLRERLSPHTSLLPAHGFNFMIEPDCGNDKKDLNHSVCTNECLLLRRGKKWNGNYLKCYLIAIMKGFKMALHHKTIDQTFH